MSGVTAGAPFGSRHQRIDMMDHGLPNPWVCDTQVALADNPYHIAVRGPMFSGIQEILLIVLIVSGIFLVPRMIKPRPVPRPVVLRRPAATFSWALRLAIVVSILWPAACALYFKPWQHALMPFAVIGIAPVVVGWSLKWVAAGLKNRR